MFALNSYHSCHIHTQYIEESYSNTNKSYFIKTLCVINTRTTLV